MEYERKLNLLNVKELKAFIKGYNLQMKIVMTKKKKEELIMEILKHTDYLNGKVIIKSHPIEGNVEAKPKVVKEKVVKPKKEVMKEVMKKDYKGIKKDFNVPTKFYTTNSRREKYIILNDLLDGQNNIYSLGNSSKLVYADYIISRLDNNTIELVIYDFRGEPKPLIHKFSISNTKEGIKEDKKEVKPMKEVFKVDIEEDKKQFKDSFGEKSWMYYHADKIRNIIMKNRDFLETIDIGRKYRGGKNLNAFNEIILDLERLQTVGSEKPSVNISKINNIYEILNKYLSMKNEAMKA